MLSRRNFLALGRRHRAWSRRAAATTTAASSGNTIAPESDEEFTDLAPAVLSSDLVRVPTTRNASRSR